MIKINEKFSCERDKYQWVLTETYLGKDKDGNPKAHTRETYHPKLEQVFSHVIDKTCGDCESLEEMKDMLMNAKKVLKIELVYDYTEAA